MCTKYYSCFNLFQPFKNILKSIHSLWATQKQAVGQIWPVHPRLLILVVDVYIKRDRAPGIAVMEETYAMGIQNRGESLGRVVMLISIWK